MAKFSRSAPKSRKDSALTHQAGGDLCEGESYTIAQTNRLPGEVKQKIYSRLIPPQIFTKFHIDPETLCHEKGESVFACCQRIKLLLSTPSY